MSSCYICETEVNEPLHNYCRCDLFCHESCFRTMVQRVVSHSEKCPVCRQKYNMEVKYGTRFLFHLPLVLLYTSCALSWTLAASLYFIDQMDLNRFFVGFNTREEVVAYEVLTLTLSAMLTLGTTVIHVRSRCTKLCRSRRVVNKVINVYCVEMNV